MHRLSLRLKMHTRHHIRFEWRIPPRGGNYFANAVLSSFLADALDEDQGLCEFFYRWVVYRAEADVLGGGGGGLGGW